MKKGFVSSSLVYSFIIVFLFITLSIISYNLNKEKLLSFINEDAKKEIEEGFLDKDTGAKEVLIGDTFEFSYTGNYQTFTVPENGTYQIELWGAQGGANGGKGAYTKGNLNLTKNTELYVYVGSQGLASSNPYSASNTNGWNGGGTGGYFTASGYLYRNAGGGGATDIRTTSTTGYRYIRDYINGSTANTGNHWIEIQAFDMNGNNVALNKTVTSDATLNRGNLIVDGNYTDGIDGGNGYGYVSETGLHYVEIDLGSEYQLSYVQIWHFYLDIRRYYSTKTVLYNSDRTVSNTVYDSAIGNIYYESNFGKKLDTNLKDRIMVAAGGGGGDGVYNGGYAGALTGGNGMIVSGSDGIAGAGGTQTAGGTSGYHAGFFGTGGDGFILNSANPNCNDASAGGGGYFGGGGGKSGGTTCSPASRASGGGGSSFISGYTGCNAIDSSGNSTGQPTHYSGYIFTNSQIIAGNASMPSSIGDTETGHSGNGYAKIVVMSLE